MRRLAQKLEEEGADSELRRYCERILRVRSTGWTQGIFANFAAESMIPKGPEWGGGNWEIKTPTNLKAIPQWELAAEVTPYMRTDDGAIPSIIADHIGVYLGSVKGRGNVVEVKEESLVKALLPAGNDVKVNGIQPSLSKIPSNKSKDQQSTPAKVESLMGLETLMQQTGGSSSVADEQAKAEEEFKKSLYGPTDGSSSDEEGNSKAKKLHIRIRNKPASTSVDVDKIKEATRQFKIGDGLGPPMSRTKSMNPSTQDIGTLLPTSTPTTSTSGMVSGASDPFGNIRIAPPAPLLPPPPGVKGVGVAAGPIPEDFFQNTIPSLQVAATLRPPGTVISKLGPNSQTSGSQGPFNQAGTAQANIGLPDGGVPPQTPQQPINNQFEPVGLPGGGVPPQSIGQVSNLPPSQVLTAQLHVSSQPLDLSVLGVPNSGPTGNQPPSPPTTARPGQVHFSKLSSTVITYNTMFIPDNI